LADIKATLFTWRNRENRESCGDRAPSEWSEVLDVDISVPLLLVGIKYIYFFHIRIVHLDMMKVFILKCKGKSKRIPLQAWTDPQGSRRLRLSDLKTIGT